VLEKAPEELSGPQRHLALLVAVGVVPPAKCDVLAIERQQSMIADGDAMRITAEIAQNLQRTTEGRFGVYHPVLPKEASQEFPEAARLPDFIEPSVKLQFLPAV